MFRNSFINLSYIFIPYTTSQVGSFNEFPPWQHLTCHPRATRLPPPRWIGFNGLQQLGNAADCTPKQKPRRKKMLTVDKDLLTKTCWKINILNPKMKVWKMICSFSKRWFLGSIFIFQGVVHKETQRFLFFTMWVPRMAKHHKIDLNDLCFDVYFNEQKIDHV